QLEHRYKITRDRREPGGLLTPTHTRKQELSLLITPCGPSVVLDGEVESKGCRFCGSVLSGKQNEWEDAPKTASSDYSSSSPLISRHIWSEKTAPCNARFVCASSGASILTSSQKSTSFRRVRVARK